MLSVPRRLIEASAIAFSLILTPCLLSAQVTATPDGAASGDVVKSSSRNVATFNVTGRGPAQLECWGTGGIECSVDAEVDLAGPTDVSVLFEAPSAEGTGYVFLRATQYVPAQCDPGSARCDRHADVASRVYVIASPPERTRN
jgi:hypothetical protein